MANPRFQSDIEPVQLKDRRADLTKAGALQHLVSVRKQTPLWYLFRVPVYLYRFHLGWLFGHRCLLLTHIGRRTGLRHQTVLEVVEYRSPGPEVVVVNGFGRNSDWVRNIEERQGEEVTVGSQHFAASHRFLGEEEAVEVIRNYEHRNRFIGPIVRKGLSWLLGWQYHGSAAERAMLVKQLPLIAFYPRETDLDVSTTSHDQKTAN